MASPTSATCFHLGASLPRWDVDKRTGFVPTRPPLGRLPPGFEAWEAVLESAVKLKLQLSEQVEKMGEEKRSKEEDKSRLWRKSVGEMPLLSIDGLKISYEQLYRAHHVLVFNLHFFSHTIPSAESIVIPRSLAIPLFQVSKYLQVPPIITYFDITLHNWRPLNSLPDGSIPPIHSLQCQTTFTSTPDEDEFHLLSTRIELRGAEALECVKLAVEKALIAKDSALEQAAEYLERGVSVIQDLRELMLGIKGRIDPEIFYNEVRPWLGGADGDLWGRPWVFEGSEEIEEWPQRWYLSGATAAQSPLMRALDIYLGVVGDGGQSSSYSAQAGKESFQERMLSYMTPQHRTFLERLRQSPHQLRALVQQVVQERGMDAPIVKAFNSAVKALKEFRDAHMVVVTLLVVGPARRAARKAAEGADPLLADGSGSAGDREKDEKMMQQAFGGGDDSSDKGALKGTGGTDLVRFLKGVRDQTTRAYLQ
ncbi:hypothetical protein D9756_003643 [Leucocoprinus leucothites]|uniref:Indoleamine 2,3-dioxygenase n=1 Tax=Leucocoprinus leucothites TaxID=201217 RepID=A0A8H5G6Q0_9AGAR|nr:hypothetical protein D9756_003643 [Leucoagaricus leucothites]